MAVDKGQQLESNVSGSKTHKSQEPCLMALNIDKSPGAKPDGSGLVLFNLRVGVKLRYGVVCGGVEASFVLTEFREREGSP